MSEEQSTFKVTDRRLFNADGTPRDVPPEEKETQSTATASSVTPPAESIPAATAAAAATSEAPESSEPTAVEDEAIPDAEDPASFVNFLMSIASNAAASLGMMEHPVTHQRDVDLELGKHWIDVLGMLQHKTQGNLTTQEQHIIDGLLSDLRMQYVSLANSPQAKSPRTYTGRDIVGGN